MNSDTTVLPARAVRDLAVCALGLASTVVFFQGLRVFLINHVYFSVSLAHAAGWLAAVTLILALVIIAPVVALRIPRYEVYSALVLGGAFLAWFKASFLGWDYGLFAGIGMDWDKYVKEAYVDIAALIAIPSYAVIRRSALLPRSGTLIAFLIVVQLVGLLVLTPLADEGNRETILGKQTGQLLARESEKLSWNSNVIILVVDTLQSDVFSELLSEGPERRAALRGFTFYRDTASSSALTWVSVPNALTGTLFDNQMPYARYLQSVYETPGSALKNLRQSGYYVELDPWGAATPMPLEATFISNTAKSSFQPRLPALASMLATATFSVMPQFVQRYLYDDVLAVVDEFFDPGYASNLKFMVDTDRLPVEFLDRPVAKFIHLRGPHIPLLGYGKHVLDYAGAARADRVGAPVTVAFTRDNYKRVSAAMLDAVIRYLSKLAQAGVYDRSAIFVLGDHGAGRQGLRFRAPSDWPKGEPQEVISSEMQSGAAAALLVKAPGAGGPFATSDAPVALSDIACTVNKSIVRKPGLDCRSLFDEPATGPRVRFFVDFRNTRFDAAGYFPPMTEYVIKDPMWLVSSWHRTGRKLLAGKIRNGRGEPYHFGKRIQFGEGSSADAYLDYGWYEPDDRAKGVRTDGRTATLTLPLGSPPMADLMLELEMTGDTVAPGVHAQRIIVHVNGVKVGEIKVSKENNYRLRVPKNAIAGDKITIRFDLPDVNSPFAATGMPDRGMPRAQMLGLTLGAAPH